MNRATIEKQKKIKQLKQEKNAVILAHYYVEDEIQEIADYVGDSFYLSKVATQVNADTIVFAGVSFMGESAKLLNPEKTILLPDADADCPMAHMVTPEKMEQIRSQYDDLAIVCYINSTAEIKCHADVCVTSSNALKIVKALPQKNIFFVPDENLGRYIAKQLPEKHFIFNEGFCHVHSTIRREEVLEVKNAHKDALFLAHPECRMEILELADYVGSTSGIIDFATSSPNQEFIIGTECGVFYELKQKNPTKTFYPVGTVQTCPQMKKLTLLKIIEVLEKQTNEVILDAHTQQSANAPLKRMMELGSR